MKKEKFPKIVVPVGTRKKIAESLRVSYDTIRKALDGQITTVNHKKIRQLAIQLGGEVLSNAVHTDD